MSMTEQLDRVIALHVLPLAQRHQWKEVNSRASDMGALRDYVAGNLYIRVANDRRLFDIEIGSVHKREDLRCVSFFKDLLAPPEKGHWHLSIEQQCEFMENKWDWLNEGLSREKSEQTIRAVDENARAKFGK